MKRWFIWGGVFLAIFLIVMAEWHSASSQRFEFYGKAWGLMLPSANREVVVLGARPYPEENLAKFNVHIYEDSSDFSQITGLKKINDENLNDVKQRVKDFQVQTMQYADFIEEDVLTAALEEFLPIPQVGDSYYYKENKKGDYFLAIVKVEESKIYTFQWTEELK